MCIPARDNTENFLKGMSSYRLCGALKIPTVTISLEICCGKVFLLISFASSLRRMFRCEWNSTRVNDEWSGWLGSSSLWIIKKKKKVFLLLHLEIRSYQTLRSEKGIFFLFFWAEKKMLKIIDNGSQSGWKTFMMLSLVSYVKLNPVRKMRNSFKNNT